MKIKATSPLYVFFSYTIIGATHCTRRVRDKPFFFKKTVYA